METLGQKIKKLRTQKNIQQSELAKRLNISPSTLCRWEKDERTPSQEDLNNITALFSLPESFFIVDDHVEPPDDTVSLQDRPTGISPKRRIIVVAAVFSLVVLILSIVIISIHGKKSFVLLSETKEINEYGEMTYTGRYLLPSNCSDSDVDSFAEGEAEEMRNDSAYDDCDSFTFYFFETEEAYANDDFIIINYYTRE